MKNKHLLYPSILSLIFLLSVFETISFSKEYKVGVVPQFEQRRLLATWSPILKYLEDQTGDLFKLSSSTSIGEFEKRFLAGEFDLAYCNPYHYIMAKRAQGYVPIIMSGSKKLQGILVASNSSGINDINQLHNQKLAFPSANALGASLLMRAELKKFHGLDIKPEYVKTHSSVYLFVAKGVMKAGGGVQRTFNEQKQSLQNKLKIIYRTAKVNPHPIIVHPRLGNDKKIEIQKLLLSLASMQAVLFENIPMNDPMQATDKDYLNLEQLGLEEFVGP
ncbi:MAG: phosphate/phosphite/phosphonate ABC transporter substrate-binding protein [Verrucomicrobiota bacterium]